MIGADEVGRGALFGPVVVSAVAVKCNNWEPIQRITKVRDSKAVKSDHRRQALAQQIRLNHDFLTGMFAAEAINQKGINWCVETLTATLIRHMVQLARGLFPGTPIRVYMDGDRGPDLSDLKCEIFILPKADARIYAVSAASIMAKTFRDRYVINLAEQNPELAPYDLHMTKGYYSEQHVEGLILRGLTPDHRTTFCKTAMATYRRKCAERSAS